jgi:hypothetical protein
MVEIERDAQSNHIIRMAQPYSSFAKTLLERQDYPDLRQYPGGPPRRPYDVTAHTLPLLMGVEVQMLETPWSDPLQRASFPPRERPTAFSAADTDTWVTINRIWAGGGTVWRNTATGEFAKEPKGSGWTRLSRPRIGLHRSWIPSMDEGWTRWLLEHVGFVYRRLFDEEIRDGNLRERYDVIVFPDESPGNIHNGYRPGTMPDEYTGGVGEQGAQALKEFAAAGGTLVFLNRSTDYAIGHLDVKARNVTRGVPSRDFYSPGSLLKVTLDSHPLTLGLPKEIAIWSEQSPAWETAESSVARYPASGLLASGWLLGEKHLAGRSALVDARMGKGRAILFGMRPQYRAQSYQTFKLLFNALCLQSP